MSERRPLPNLLILLLPPALIWASYGNFTGFAERTDPRTAYLLGYAMYWIICLAISVYALRGAGLRSLLSGSHEPGIARVAGRPVWTGIVALTVPLLLGVALFIAHIPFITPTVIVAVLAVAVVNGTVEEIFWRGLLARAFPDNAILGWLYPAFMYGLWHIAPLSVNPFRLGTPYFVVYSTILALAWGWVAWRTQSIRWTIALHILVDALTFKAVFFMSAGMQNFTPDMLP